MTNFWFSSTGILLLLGGIFIIGGLAFYASKLLKQLSSQSKAQKQQQHDDAERTEQNQKKMQVHDKKVLNSIVIIVRAMKEEQCDFSEGCWRLAVLLGSLKAQTIDETKYPAIFDLYHQIKALDILDSRKELDKRQRMQQDLIRLKAESALSEKIKIDLEALHTSIEQLLTLH